MFVSCERRPCIDLTKKTNFDELQLHNLIFCISKINELKFINKFHMSGTDALKYGDVTGVT